MQLAELVQGSTYSFERHGIMHTGIYQEYFEEATVTAERPGTRTVAVSKKTGEECVQIQVPNPKGGAPLGYQVALADLVEGTG